MTRDEYNNYQTELFKKCQAVSNSKGNEYSGTEDTHANFKRLSKKLDIPKEKVLMVYLTKHLDSIDSFIRSGCNTENLTEPIEGRIMDAIVYLSLLGAMIQDNDDLELWKNQKKR